MPASASCTHYCLSFGGIYVVSCLRGTPEYAKFVTNGVLNRLEARTDTVVDGLSVISVHYTTVEPGTFFVMMV